MPSFKTKLDINMNLAGTGLECDAQSLETLGASRSITGARDGTHTQRSMNEQSTASRAPASPTSAALKIVRMEQSFGGESLTSSRRAKKLERLCMFYTEPITKPDWRLKGFNKWRKGLKPAKIPDHNDPEAGFDDGCGSLTKH